MAVRRQKVATLHRERFVRSWPAVPASVAEVRRAGGGFAGRPHATPPAPAPLPLAASEATTNAVQHAYADCQAPGPVLITAEPTDGCLRVAVQDEGSACGRARTALASGSACRSSRR